MTDPPSAERPLAQPAEGVPAGFAGRSEYLWDVLAALWPPPARIAACGPTVRRTGGTTEFLVLPSERRATLLIPRRPLPAAAGALRNYKASATARDRLQFRAMALAARAGLGELLPHRIRIEPGQRTGEAQRPGEAQRTGAADIVGYLRAALGRDIVVSLHIGPARANRKPVLQALTPAGETAGFVKIGLNALTGELVCAEATSLAFLASARLAHVQPPRLLHHGTWRGHQVLVQQGFRASGYATDRAELSRAMAELAAVRGLDSLLVTESPYWHSLRARLRSLRQGSLAGPLLQVLNQLEPLASGTRLAFGCWHGDWTPWNMTMSDGCALVWDWERFGAGVPVGYDAVHYQLQGAVVRDSVAADVAAETAITRAAGILAPLRVEPAAATLVAMLYLVEIAARYLHDGQAEAGARLGRIDTWLLPVLSRHALRLSGSPGG
jgi:hypothetical protein